MTDKNKLGNILERLVLLFMVFIIYFFIALVTVAFASAFMIDWMPLSSYNIYSFYLPIIIFIALLLTLIDWVNESTKSSRSKYNW